MEIEVLLFDYYNNTFAYAHQVAFFSFGFLGSIAIIKTLTKEKISKLLNLLPWICLILPLAPIIDHFIFLRSYGYGYLPISFTNINSFIQNIVFFTGIAQRTLFFLSAVFSTLYIYIKTQSIFKSVIGFLSLGFLIFLLAMLGTIPYSLFHIRMTQLSFFFLYFFLSMISIMIIIKQSKKGLITSLFNSLSPIQTIFLILMVMTGVIFSGNFSLSNAIISNIIISILVVTFVWWFTVLLNHIYDFEIDEMSNPERILPSGMLTISQAKNIAAIFGFISIGLSFLLSFPMMPIGTGIALLLGYIYSAPPFRLRNKIFSTLFLGLGCSLAFALGYLASVISTKSYFLRAWVGFLETPISTFVFFIIIFISFSLGATLKDIKDLEGDKQHGVKNIFTAYGKKKGVKIVSIFLLISCLLPLSIFHEVHDFIIFLFLGIFIVFIFRRYEKVNITMALSIFIPIYCILRLGGFF